MAEFTADIAGMLEVFAIAAGLVLLHRASKEGPAKLLKAAGWVLVVGGVAIGACTMVYWFKYQSRGDFDGAHMSCPGVMHGRGTGMNPATMGSGMGSMPQGMTPAPASPEGTR